MRFATVCSGIEAATVAWSPLNWRPVFFSEIAPFPSAVLAHRFPHVANLGDMENFRSWPDADFDVLAGGTPCQSFSVAGFRAGLTDRRGNLALVYLEILRRYQPRWFIWENVPGVLSSDSGRGLGALFAGMADLGYGFAWRVLDAQFFGVPQRRRRIFVVGCLGSWARAAAVLFDPDSLRGNYSPRRKAGPLDPRTLEVGPRTRGALASATDGITSGTVSPKWKKGTGGPAGDECQNLTVIPFDRAQITHKENRARPMPTDPSPTIASTGQPCVAFDAFPARGEGGATIFRGTDVAAALRAIDPSRTDRGTRVIDGPAVRRFTPLECERLQGFPDHWTAITYKGQPAKDSPRYEAVGNAIAVPVLKWIGERLETVEGMK